MALNRNLMIGALIVIVIIIIIIVWMYYPRTMTTADVIAKYGLTSTNSIRSGIGLPNSAFVSNGTAWLGMQGDGNLVLYTNHPAAPKPVQATMSVGQGNYATLGNDGVLKVVSVAGAPLWTGAKPVGATGTWFIKVNPDATLSLISPAGVSTLYSMGVKL